MPALPLHEAAEKVAQGVESARPTVLREIYSEIYPEKPPVESPSAAELARLVRGELEPEEIVDLWNVVYPADRNVWYDEEDEQVHYNEELAEYTDAD